jgi:hypothetical protein
VPTALNYNFGAFLGGLKSAATILTVPMGLFKLRRSFIRPLRLKTKICMDALSPNFKRYVRRCGDQITSSFFLKKNYLIWKSIFQMLEFIKGPLSILGFSKPMNKTKTLQLFDNSSTKPYLFVFLKKKLSNMEKHIPNVRIYKRGPSVFWAIFYKSDLTIALLLPPNPCPYKYNFHLPCPK